MKVKLLKKVRKRYEITMIESISSKDDSWFMIEAKSKFGLPFFIFEDNNDCLGARTVAVGNIESAMVHLKETIRSDYTKIVRPQKEVRTKIWYSRQHK